MESSKKNGIIRVVIIIIEILALAGIIALLAYLFNMYSVNRSAETTAKESVMQGSVKSTEVNINSMLEGTVAEVLVSEGDAVSEGDLLIRIDADIVKTQVDQAKAAVGEAKAALAQAQATRAGYVAARAGHESTRAAAVSAQSTAAAAVKAAEGQRAAAEATLAAAEAAKAGYEATLNKALNGAREEDIAQAEAAFNYAQKSYERMETLYNEGAVSAQDFDEVEAKYLAAKAVYEEAQNGARSEDIDAAQAQVNAADAQVNAAAANVQAASAQVSAAQAQHQAAGDQVGAAAAQVSAAQAQIDAADAAISQYRSTIERAQAALEQAEAYLARAEITAPESGTVSAVNVNAGELVSTGMALATLKSDADAWIEVNLRETYLEKISEGDEVTFTLTSYPDSEFTGYISSINKNPDFATKKATNENGSFDILSYAVKIEPLDVDVELYSGMTVMVDFEPEEEEEKEEEGEGGEGAEGDDGGKESEGGFSIKRTVREIAAASLMSPRVRSASEDTHRL